jgi:hypothetical protein
MRGSQKTRPIESSALRCAAFRCALLRDAGRTSPLDPPFRHQGASQKQSILLSYLFRFAPVHFAQRNWNLTVRKSYSPGSQVPSHGQTGSYRFVRRISTDKRASVHKPACTPRWSATRKLRFRTERDVRGGCRCTLLGPNCPPYPNRRSASFVCLKFAIQGGMSFSSLPAKSLVEAISFGTVERDPRIIRT